MVMEVPVVNAVVVGLAEADAVVAAAAGADAEAAGADADVGASSRCPVAAAIVAPGWLQMLVVVDAS